MHLANILTWLSLLWSVAGLSVSDRDVNQLGEHWRFDCFSKGNLIPLTYLKVSSWIGFLGSQDTKAASGRFSARPVVLLWHSVKPLSLIIQGVLSAKQYAWSKICSKSGDNFQKAHSCKNGISYDYNSCDSQKVTLQSFVLLLIIVMEVYYFSIYISKSNNTTWFFLFFFSVLYCCGRFSNLAWKQTLLLS